jgi:hypothetical protein
LTGLFFAIIGSVLFLGERMTVQSIVDFVGVLC